MFLSEEAYFPPRGLFFVNFYLITVVIILSPCRVLGNYRKKKKRKLTSFKSLLPRDKHCWDFDDLICICVYIRVERDRDRNRDWSRFVTFLFFDPLIEPGFFVSYLGWRFLDLRERWSGLLMEKRACDPVAMKMELHGSFDSSQRGNFKRRILFVTKWIFRASEVLLSKWHFQNYWYTMMSGIGSLFLNGLCSLT